MRALATFGFEPASTRGSHAKLRRSLAGAGVQILTIPIHKSLAPGTLRAIYRQACRFVPEAELRRYFFTD